MFRPKEIIWPVNDTHPPRTNNNQTRAIVKRLKFVKRCETMNLVVVRFPRSLIKGHFHFHLQNTTIKTPFILANFSRGEKWKKEENKFWRYYHLRKTESWFYGIRLKAYLQYRSKENEDKKNRESRISIKISNSETLPTWVSLPRHCEHLSFLQKINYNFYFCWKNLLEWKRK